MQNVNVAIAGAGVIGLAAALELASAGLRVAVFERGHAMRECSWAAAGMLAAADPENPPALRPLSQLSLGLYPEFLANIERLSGHKIPIRTKQTLQGSHSLPRVASPLVAATPLTPAAIHAIAPGLQSSGLKFILFEEHSLDPRDLVLALPKAAQAAGITLLEQTAVTAIKSHRGFVQIQTTRGEWTAAHFINACGAWASDLANVPIIPRKGQMLLVEIPESAIPEPPTSPHLATALRTPDIYLLPRGNGRIIIGATVEDAGFDKRVDPATIAALHNAAAELWPPIRNARILDTWAGLRPATADSLPVIGPSTPIDAEMGSLDSGYRPRFWLALGHFRNGILLAPGTARLLCQMILKEPLSVDASAFHAGRLTACLAQ
jgi:glycine oxidase